MIVADLMYKSIAGVAILENAAAAATLAAAPTSIPGEAAIVV
jgi:hypothetical protein